MFIKNIYLRSELTKKYYLESRVHHPKPSTHFNPKHHAQNNPGCFLAHFYNQCAGTKHQCAFCLIILERGFFVRQTPPWLDKQSTQRQQHSLGMYQPTFPRFIRARSAGTFFSVKKRWFPSSIRSRHQGRKCLPPVGKSRDMARCLHSDFGHRLFKKKFCRTEISAKFHVERLGETSSGWWFDRCRFG